MREIWITLTTGVEISGVVADNGAIYSPYGRSLTSDMVKSTRPANLDGYGNDLDSYRR